MSEMSEKARAALKSKAERMTRADPHARVDASGYSPDGLLDGNVQTGPRPLSRRQYRSGGHVSGEASTPRADRKRRASGGRTALTADSYQNRDMKDANEERDGSKHTGGMKHGGSARAKGGAINDGTRPTGGRLARKGGGRTKKGTNVNIIIAPQGSGASVPPPRQMPVPTATPPGVPVGLHQGAPPVMPAAVPMRARGGGVYPIDVGAGSGLGRLEKAKRAARS